MVSPAAATLLASLLLFLAGVGAARRGKRLLGSFLGDEAIVRTRLAQDVYDRVLCGPVGVGNFAAVGFERHLQVRLEHLAGHGATGAGGALGQGAQLAAERV